MSETVLRGQDGIPVRMPLKTPLAMTEVKAVYRRQGRGFHASVAGAWSGSIILEGHYGDGIWNSFATYQANAEDFGDMTAPFCFLRFRAGSDFSGEALCLLIQEGMFIQ